jgi:hypothetical protein
LASFEPKITNFETRLFDAYAAEVTRADTNGDGVISAAEGDVDTASDGLQTMLDCLFQLRSSIDSR